MGQHQQAGGPGNGLQVAGSDLGGQPVRPVAFAGAWRRRGIGLDLDTTTVCVDVGVQGDANGGDPAVPGKPAPLPSALLRHRARTRERAPWIDFGYSSGAAVKVKVQAWGNSLGLRIPKAYAAELGVGSGSEMEVKVEAGALLARPADAIHLEALLAEITADNQHSETEWGGAIGAEVW